MSVDRPPGRRLPAWLVLAVAVPLLGGCSHGAAGAQPQATGRSPSPLVHESADQASGSAAPLGPPAPGSTGIPVDDSRGCLSVQALMGHLSADTARWSPNLDPFEPTIATRIQTLSVDLGKQVPLAGTAQLQDAERANARAFAVLATAMHGKDKGKVTEAVAGTRVAYRDLKGLCHFE